MITVGGSVPKAAQDGAFAGVRSALEQMEAAGLDHAFIADHVSFHTGWGIDGLLEAAIYLAATERMAASVGVYLLPLRHPIPVARQIAQIAQRFPGRLIFGVGIGGEDRSEVANCGVDPATRGARCNESLSVLRAAMTGARFDFHGEHFELAGAHITPAPNPAVPILVGGRDERALRRAGTYGDGWLGAFATPEQFERRLAVVNQAAADAERTCTQHGLQPWVGIADNKVDARAAVAPVVEGMYRIPFEKFERFTPHGTPAEVAEALRPYAHLGATTFNISAQAPTPEMAIEGMAEIRRLLRAP